MLYTTWTSLLFLSFIIETLGKTLTATEHRQLAPVSDPQYMEQVELIKQRLRSALPRRSVYNSIPQLNRTIEEQRRLLREYRQKLSELDELDESMDYAHEAIHKRDLHSYTSSDNGATVGSYYFPVHIAQPKNHTSEIKVQSAMLKLYRQSSLALPASDKQTIKLSAKRNIGYNTVLLVYQTLPGKMRRLVTSKVISLAQSGWIKLDVTEIAQSWVNEPGLNHGLEIECTSQNISQILTDSEDTALKPTLDILAYEQKINVRRKRRQVAVDDTCRPGTCCKQSVNISYRDVGIHDEMFHGGDEIVQAFFCTGGCPLGHRPSNMWSRTKYTLLRNYPSSKYEMRCAPSSFSSFNYFHLDNEFSVTMTTLDDLIVEECECL